MPDFLALSQSADPNLRAGAVAILGEMLVMEKTAPGSLIPPNQRAHAKATVVAGLKDEDESGAAVEAPC